MYDPTSSLDPGHQKDVCGVLFEVVIALCRKHSKRVSTTLG